MLPVQTVMLAALFAALLPILHRMGFLPNQAGRLRLWKRPEKKSNPAKNAQPWES